ncbi:hypothetical protein INP57_24955 [Saccharopolyspora sp. HNM0986]|uniref:hypothetical protein n=1 Tax=Saccharopolyspora galaxeae TaxID=2781241 RepID=UPI00190D0A7A|nr:hypothetical protein [Saccharopolyspora sp. HNM0986]MBK0870065.1 hypothetical protein [Saccharopolyspora sp. HNM0986]
MSALAQDTGGSATVAARSVRYAVTPLVLAAVLLALYGYISVQPLDLIEQRSLNVEYLLSRTAKHLVLTAIVTTLILSVAIPVGVLLTRSWAGRISAPLLAAANIGQAVPSLGLIASIRSARSCSYESERPQ